MTEAGHQPPNQATTAQNRHFGFRLFNRRYFLKFALGEERRSSQRLDTEGQQRVSMLPIASGIAGALLLALFGLLCCLYLVKALAGLDLFEGTSVLHPIYELFHK